MKKEKQMTVEEYVTSQGIALKYDDKVCKIVISLIEKSQFVMLNRVFKYDCITSAHYAHYYKEGLTNNLFLEFTADSTVKDFSQINF